jgi:hypothetical protein
MSVQAENGKPLSFNVNVKVESVRRQLRLRH